MTNFDISKIKSLPYECRTRDGRRAIVRLTDVAGELPLFVEVEKQNGKFDGLCYDRNGHLYIHNNRITSLDLMMPPERVKVWGYTGAYGLWSKGIKQDSYLVPSCSAWLVEGEWAEEGDKP